MFISYNTCLYLWKVEEILKIFLGHICSLHILLNCCLRFQVIRVKIRERYDSLNRGLCVDLNPRNLNIFFILFILTLIKKEERIKQKDLRQGRYVNEECC